MVIWDYFMRRKWLLLTVLAVFLLSGTVSGYFLQRSDTYIVDSTVLNQPQNVEETTLDTVARVQVPILSEEEAAAATVAAEDTAATDEAASQDAGTANTDSEMADQALDATSSETQQERPSDTTNIDVPLAGGSTQSDVNEAWRTLFATWQYATWSIFGIIAIALTVVLLARWAFWRKIR